MGNGALVRGQEGVVELLKLLGLGQQLVKLGIDDLGDLGVKGLGEGVEGLAETQQLQVESRVGGVDSVCS